VYTARHKLPGTEEDIIYRSFLFIRPPST